MRYSSFAIAGLLAFCDASVSKRRRVEDVCASLLDGNEDFLRDLKSTNIKLPSGGSGSDSD